MEKIANKTHQLIGLSMYIQKNSKYTTTLVLNGQSDTFITKIVNSNNKKVVDMSIENFSKKSESLVLKELEKISKELLDIKYKIDGIEFKEEKSNNKNFIKKLFRL
jgi:hypothetical protein